MANPQAGVEEVEKGRIWACRLEPDRALSTLDEAEDFLHDRGLLTLMPDCSLPSLFGACHEEPYKPGGRGFASWPKTKWWWGGALAGRPGVVVARIHAGKGVFLTEHTAALADPLCRAELAAADAGDSGPGEQRLVRHLADAGPAAVDELKEELGLGVKTYARCGPASSASVRSWRRISAWRRRPAATGTRASSSAGTSCSRIRLPEPEARRNSSSRVSKPRWSRPSARREAGFPGESPRAISRRSSRQGACAGRRPACSAKRKRLPRQGRQYGRRDPRRRDCLPRRVTERARGLPEAQKVARRLQGRSGASGDERLNRPCRGLGIRAPAGRQREAPVTVLEPAQKTEPPADGSA
jgi:hypothetical protein